MHLSFQGVCISTPLNPSGSSLSLKAGTTATETELRNYARDHLAHFKCPQRIQFVSELPKTATGKVQKYVLRGKPAISKQ
jgi:fatty-acyl-CoA synthase